jgi:hypothetical protein
MGFSLASDTWKKLRLGQRFARRELVHLNLQILYECNSAAGSATSGRSPGTAIPGSTWARSR